MQPIYLDHNATTPIDPRVRDAVLATMDDLFGNPGSAHRVGRRARQALEDAREEIADLLTAYPDEVVFTSGATEANNLALFGLAGNAPGVVVTSPVEHPSVSEPVVHLERAGFVVHRLPVSPTGVVRVKAHEAQLVTCQLVNHETGAVHPIEELTDVYQAPFHCDAVQAVGKRPVSFAGLGVTTLALSAHKFHGPKGIGALLVKRGTTLTPLLRGGHQQHGTRPGTEPVPLVVGLAVALRLAVEGMTNRIDHLRNLREQFLARLPQPFHVNGPADGLPHVLNVSFPGLAGDALLIALDLAGIACSTGSACSSGSLLPSPVLREMGVEEARLRSALRFSFGYQQGEAEIDEAARRICLTVERLRRAE